MIDGERECPGSYLVLHEETDTHWHVCAYERHQIDTAVTAWIESGGTRDSVLSLSTPEGAEVRLLASRVASWFLSTPKSRLERLRQQQRLDAEEEAFRAELGIWESPE